MNLKFLDPSSIPHWDAEVATFPEANIFHTAAWARTLMESYRYEPHYAVWYEGDTPAAIVPVMEVKSFITGTRGVSLPFTDICPMLSRGPIYAPEAMDQLSDFGRVKGWKALETRGLVEEAGEEDIPPAYYVHELDLLPGEEHLLSQVRSSTRRNIRKSEKQDVHVVEENSIKGLREFIRLNTLTRRDHGLPPQPRRFFESLYKNVIEPGMGRILLAVHEGQYIASAVFLHFNGHAMYKYGASDKKYQNLRANNLLMWEAIRTYSSQGARTFHFGRTEPENT
ncbi:GNAT family N-acetyltransferase, partial [bacterium]|nr:GNAT family N-acetyltransferase [bacterium]